MKCQNTTTQDRRQSFAQITPNCALCTFFCVYYDFKITFLAGLSGDGGEMCSTLRNGLLVTMALLGNATEIIIGKSIGFSTALNQHFFIDTTFFWIAELATVGIVMLILILVFENKAMHK